MKVVSIGAGNVAWHLMQRLHDAGHEIVQVYSRTMDHAQGLATRFGSTATIDLASLYAYADLYIVCLRDDISLSLVSNFALRLGPHQIICHTSGVLKSDLFMPIAENYGSFYPFQTLSKEVALAHELLPMIIQANNPESFDKLELVAQQISTQVYTLSDEQKTHLHITGVIANNFTNHLIHHAQEILLAQNIDPKLLIPLISNTVNKLNTVTALKSQTGPARRNDRQTIAKHLELIENPELKKIYSLITESIIKTHHENR